MARKDWVSVGIHTALIQKLDKFLESKDASEIGVTNRQQIIDLVLRKFLDQGTSMLEIGSEMNELRKERNTATNMLEMMTKGFQVNDEIKIEVKGKKIFAKDKNLNKTIEMTLDDDGAPYCTYHEASWCNHIMKWVLMGIAIGLENVSKRALESKTKTK